MNKDFLLGLATGAVIAMAISMGIFYFYVVNSVESAKEEVKETITVVQDNWEQKWKGELDELKDATKDRFKEEKEAALEKLKGKVSDYLNSKEDSTATE